MRKYIQILYNIVFDSFELHFVGLFDQIYIHIYTHEGVTDKRFDKSIAVKINYVELLYFINI